MKRVTIHTLRVHIRKKTKKLALGSRSSSYVLGQLDAYMDISKLLQIDMRLKTCAAEDCENIFLVHPSGVGHRFCSTRAVLEHGINVTGREDMKERVSSENLEKVTVRLDSDLAKRMRTRANALDKTQAKYISDLVSADLAHAARAGPLDL